MSQAELLSEVSPVPPFQFQNHPIRTQLKGETLWFVARDICSALNIGWTGHTLDAIPADWKGLVKLTTPSGNQQVRAIIEPAVYKLAFRSNKPEADAFTNWIASEVVPSIRKTGRYEVKPVPFPTPSPISKRTDPERKALTAIINTWVGMAPIHYASARAQVNAHFGVTSVDALTVAQVKEAIQWVQAKIDALPAVPAPARTPVLPASSIYADRMKALDRLEEEWIEFAGETRSRLHQFVNELLRVKESTYPELLNRICSRQNISKDPLLGILQSNSYNAQTWIDAGISEMRAAIRAAKTANRLMLG
jgi:prophage antirepressor-like protein